MKPLPPLKSLPVFHAVAKYASFSRAAELLCVTHSAVSQSVKALEDFLGVKLFLRDRGGVKLTEDGKRYYQRVDEALRIIQGATRRILRKASVTALNVNVLSSFAMRWLIARMPRFQEAFPGCELRLAAEWRRVDFDLEDIDLAVYYGDGHWPSLHVESMFSEEIMVLASPRFLQEFGPIDLEGSLNDYKFLYVKTMMKEDNMTIWLDGTDHPEPAQSSRIYFRDASQAVQAAHNGAGLIAMNVSFSVDDMRNGSLVQAIPKTVKTGKAYYLVSPHDRQADPNINAFCTWIQEEVKATMQEQAEIHAAAFSLDKSGDDSSV